MRFSKSEVETACFGFTRAVERLLYALTLPTRPENGIEV